MAKISVCVATYNGEKYIYKQLKSILEQLDINDEVIISDDFSSDQTISEVNRFDDDRIIIVYNSYERGYTSNFENALKHASGDIIFLSDQDDVWLPNKVDYCVEILQNKDFVVTDCKVIDDINHTIVESFYERRKSYKTLIGNLLKFGYLGCCFAFRKEILQKALPFPSNRKYCTHDNWLMLVAIQYFRYYISEEKMILYMRHQNNTSDGGFGSKSTLIFKIKYRLYLLLHLLMRLFY